VQCTVFDGFSGEVALTAGGGRRGLPLLKNSFEDVALVSLLFINECLSLKMVIMEELQFSIIYVLLITADKV